MGDVGEAFRARREYDKERKERNLYLRWVRARAGGAIGLEDVEDILLAVAPQQGGGYAN